MDGDPFFLGRESFNAKAINKPLDSHFTYRPFPCTPQPLLAIIVPKYSAVGML